MTTFYINPAWNEVAHLKGKYLFERNKIKIRRYIDLGLDFFVYAEGKVCLVRHKEAVTAKTRRELLSKWDGLCSMCKQPTDKPHIDHIVPIAYGGTRDKTNLQIVCQRCNWGKGASLPRGKRNG